MRLYAKKRAPQPVCPFVSESTGGFKEGQWAWLGFAFQLTRWTNHIACGFAEGGTPPCPPKATCILTTALGTEACTVSQPSKDVHDKAGHPKLTPPEPSLSVSMPPTSHGDWKCVPVATDRGKGNIFRRLFLERLNPVLPPPCPGSRPS